MTYETRRDHLRRSLIDGHHILALEAMEFAERFHIGLRKDGSPEFSHQVEMAEMILSLPSVRQLDATLAVCFLHDVREDYGILDDTLRLRFGSIIADAVDLLTKEFRGHRLDASEAYSRISSNAIASVVKGVDRTHNLRTMNGAFCAEKKKEYEAETSLHIRPMLISARRRHKCRNAALSHIIGGIDRLVPKPGQALPA